MQQQQDERTYSNARGEVESLSLRAEEAASNPVHDEIDLVNGMFASNNSNVIPTPEDAGLSVGTRANLLLNCRFKDRSSLADSCICTLCSFLIQIVSRAAKLLKTV